MKKQLLIVLLVLMFTLMTASAGLAANGIPPVGTCRVGFHIEPFHQHEGEEHDHHVGLAQDLNQNGWICVKHVSSEIHVHFDDVIR